MTTNGSITVWHYDDVNECYTKKKFIGVSMQNVQKSSTALGKGTRTEVRVCKIRIPTTAKVELHLGDYVRIGLSSDKEPERGCDMVITEIADNRRGTNPHWRVLCE